MDNSAPSHYFIIDWHSNHVPGPDIHTYLELLRPVSMHLLNDNGVDRTCPLCLEPYVDLSDDRVTDYPVRPGIQRSGFQCDHVFGRLCIEQHIQSGEEYSTRCPICICREEWFNPRNCSPDEIELHITHHRFRRRRNAQVAVLPTEPGADDVPNYGTVSESDWSDISSDSENSGQVVSPHSLVRCVGSSI
jgi:hypothetical protein